MFTLEPDADGNYHVTQDPVGRVGGSDADGIDEEDGGDQASEHRQIVFLDARALLRAR